MKIIAGIPAYNKQYPVCGVIHAAEEYVNEVIVVDDGSTDNTSKLAKRAGAVVLRHETNKGKNCSGSNADKRSDKARCGRAGFIRFGRTARP